MIWTHQWKRWHPRRQHVLVDERPPRRERRRLVLSTEALEFVADARPHASARGCRSSSQARRAPGATRRDGAAKRPTSSPRPRACGASDWTCSRRCPALLLDRRVEITGPVDRKMIINALNSGANVFMADFEDATTPTWTNLVDGQHNLYDAIRRTITFDAEARKKYALNEKTAVLFVRPRGWHLPEKHVVVDGETAPRRARRLRPLLLPQREGARRARRGPVSSTCPSSRATSRRACGTTCSFAPRRSSASRAAPSRPRSSIETLPAAFEMDEILYELREHSAGLNCGRWDYIFSFIKKRANDPAAHPARSRAGHDGQGVPERLRAAAHQDVPPPRRARDGRHGGADPDQGRRREANDEALAKVRADKLREVTDGHDGTWVAHPGPRRDRARGLRRALPGPNQLDVDARRRERHGRRPPRSQRRARAPSAGSARNVRVGIQYLEAWLARQGLRADLQPDGRRGDGRDLAQRRCGSGCATARARRWSSVTRELVRARSSPRRLRVDRARVGEARFDNAAASRGARSCSSAVLRRADRFDRVPHPRRVRATSPTQPNLETPMRSPSEPRRQRQARTGEASPARCEGRHRASVLRGRRRQACAAAPRSSTRSRRSARNVCGTCSRRALRARARRAHRQPGGAAGPRGLQGDLPLGLAGRRRRERVGPDVPGPEPVSGRTACPTS